MGGSQNFGTVKDFGTVMSLGQSTGSAIANKNVVVDFTPGKFNSY